MNSEGVVVSSGNLSIAWAQAFLRLYAAPYGELPHPLILSITDFDKSGQVVEIASIRAALNEFIATYRRTTSLGFQPVSATASTLFPHMCWSPQLATSADALFGHYIERVYPRLKSRCKLNSRGTYFLRMIQSQGQRPDGSRVNQLADILKWWRRDSANGKRTRRSGMQVGIYDPPTDHNGSGQAGFPCLQQVSFGWSKGGLTVSAYYPTEWISERGYGNYLGLCNLGTFMAHEMRIKLYRVNIMVALPELGQLGKGELKPLADSLRAIANMRSQEAIA